jgi:hypothetical protein
VLLLGKKDYSNKHFNNKKDRLKRGGKKTVSRDFRAIKPENPRKQIPMLVVPFPFKTAFHKKQPSKDDLVIYHVQKPLSIELYTFYEQTKTPLLAGFFVNFL